VLREVQALGKMKCEWIPALYDVIESQSQLYLVMELVQGPTLQMRLKSPLTPVDSTFSCLPLPECKAIMRQLLSAVSYMHSEQICHRDVKLDNMIVDSVGRLKLIDFGFATPFKDKLKNQCGTPSYMAPEQTLDQPYTQKVDVWACGVVMYAITMG